MMDLACIYGWITAMITLCLGPYHIAICRNGKMSLTYRVNPPRLGCIYEPFKNFGRLTRLFSLRVKAGQCLPTRRVEFSFFMFKREGVHNLVSSSWPKTHAKKPKTNN